MSHNKAKTSKQGHAFTKKICHWFYCKNCGLVALKNDATEKRIREGCDG